MKASKEGARVKLIWNTIDAEDIEEAEAFFVKLTKQGWLALKFEGKYSRVVEFIPDLGELWFIPLSEGG
jgi:hypothetical protein